MKKSTRLGMVGSTLMLAAGLAIGPAATASATVYSLQGSVSKYGWNTYFTTARAHSSGPIRINISKFQGCGGSLYFSLRRGVSSSSPRVTNVVRIARLGTSYGFTKKGSTSTTLPKGTYYVTAASDPGAGCPGVTSLPFGGVLNI